VIRSFTHAMAQTPRGVRSVCRCIFRGKKLDTPEQERCDRMSDARECTITVSDDEKERRRAMLDHVIAHMIAQYW
jgi:hypothetical protein